MEDIDPEFPAKITPGKSMIVAGSNFGWAHRASRRLW